MQERKIIFDVWTSHLGGIDWSSKSTFKADEILCVKYKFLSPYVGGQKLAVRKPDGEIINVACRDIHSDSAALIWENLIVNGRADLFVKTPDGTSARVIGVVEAVGHFEPAPVLPSNPRHNGAAQL